MIALATTTIAILIAIAVTFAWIVYAFFNWASGRSEIGSEIELAANRKPYYDDEVLEGKRLERVQFLGVVLLATITIGLPVYWLYEPQRQANAEEGFTNRFASWGSQLFDVTANGGFNCAGCHGGMNATGGAAESTVTDSKTGEVKAGSWKAPALNTDQDLYVSEALKTGRVMVKDEDVCLHCGMCAERCPTGAWDMHKFLFSVTHAGPGCREPQRRAA